AAAKRTAELLAVPPQSADVGPMLDAVLSRKKGVDALVKEMKSAHLNPDAAKLALRHLNTVGQQNAALIELLRNVVGTGSLTPVLMKEDQNGLMKEVLAAGNPERGERVFRRTDLACLSCHSVAGAGGPVGPDLEGLGASSPLDYIVTSVLDPNKAIRE